MWTCVFFSQQGITASTARSLYLLGALDTWHHTTTWAGMSAVCLSQGNGSSLISRRRQDRLTTLFERYLPEDCEQLSRKRKQKTKNTEIKQTCEDPLLKKTLRSQTQSSLHQPKSLVLLDFHLEAWTGYTFGVLPSFSGSLRHREVVATCATCEN